MFSLWALWFSFDNTSKTKGGGRKKIWSIKETGKNGMATVLKLTRCNKGENNDS